MTPAQFKKQAVKLIRSHGYVPPPGLSGLDYFVQWDCSVAVMDGWVHIRIPTDRSIPVWGEWNSYSGKWNIHMYHGKKPALGEILVELGRRLKHIQDCKTAAICSGSRSADPV